MFAVSSTRWSPSLATLLLVMSTTLQPFLLPGKASSSPESVCDSKAAEKGEQCKAEAPKKFPDSENNPEMRCKASYYIVDCALQAICKYCTDSETKEQFNLVRQALDLVREACKQWSSDEPKVECPANVSTVGPVTPSLPGNISGSPASVCDSKTAENEAECEAEALKRYPDIKNNPEMSCKAAYYIADCAVQAICKYCTDSETKKPFNEARQALDEIREGCKQWSSDEPKLECPSSSTTTTSSNTMMIVGIIIGVIVLLVAISVAVYCLCFSTDKSVGPSSNAGAGGGSRASSKINSGKAGSTMGSKQQSRASGGAKQQSRIGAKQSRRASGGAKQQSRIGAKQSRRA